MGIRKHKEGKSFKKMVIELKIRRMMELQNWFIHGVTNKIDRIIKKSTILLLLSRPYQPSS